MALTAAFVFLKSDLFIQKNSTHWYFLVTLTLGRVLTSLNTTSLSIKLASMNIFAVLPWFPFGIRVGFPDLYFFLRILSFPHDKLVW